RSPRGRPMGPSREPCSTSSRRATSSTRRSSVPRASWWPPDGRRQGSIQDARRRQEGLRRGDQEGVPQARAAVPPGQEPGRGGGPGGAGPRRERGRDLETDVHISFEQAMEGAQAPVSVSLAAPCPTCHGSGAKPGTQPTICPRCQGRGIESQGQGLFSISQPCSKCGGTGTEIKEPCPTCHGLGQTQQIKRYRLNVPAGVKDGSRVRPPGQGQPGPRARQPGRLQ